MTKITMLLKRLKSAAILGTWIYSVATLAVLIREHHYMHAGWEAYYFTLQLPCEQVFVKAVIPDRGGHGCVHIGDVLRAQNKVRALYS
jgi:hypothetical protein